MHPKEYVAMQTGLAEAPNVMRHVSELTRVLANVKNNPGEDDGG